MHDLPTSPRRPITRLIAAGGAAALLALGVAGCGDTKASSSATAPTAAAKPVAYCKGVIAFDAFVNSGDGPPDATKATALLTQLVKDAPPGMKQTTTDLQAEVTSILSAPDGGSPTPKFDELSGQIEEYVGSNCGYGRLEIDAINYAFEGISKSMDAGIKVVKFTNAGDNAHEANFFRINDGVTDSLKDLASLPEAEALKKVTPIAHVGADPGKTSWTSIDMSRPGRYGVICFVSQGMTSMSDTAHQSGTPHAALGMQQEFTVT